MADDNPGASAPSRCFNVYVDKSNNRLGSAVVKVAKAFGPLSVALALADAVCDLSDICNIDGMWGKSPEFDSNDYPSEAPPGYYWVAAPANNGPTRSAACAVYSSAIKAQNPSLSAVIEGENCRVLIDGQPNGSLQHIFREPSGCPTNYLLVGGSCVLQGSNSSEVTEAD